MNQTDLDKLSNPIFFDARRCIQKMIAVEEEFPLAYHRLKESCETTINALEGRPAVVPLVFNPMAFQGCIARWQMANVELRKTISRLPDKWQKKAISVLRLESIKEDAKSIN